MMKSALSAITTVSCVILASSASASAHSGEHAFSFGGTLSHMLGSADHVAMIVGAIAAGAGLAYAVRFVKRSR